MSAVYDFVQTDVEIKVVYCGFLEWQARVYVEGELEAITQSYRTPWGTRRAGERIAGRLMGFEALP